MKKIVYFSPPFKGLSLYDNPKSFPDLKILIIGTEINNKECYREIYAHRCFIANSSDVLRDGFEEDTNGTLLKLRCSSDFEAMHCEKAIKSIYTTVSIEGDEFAPMYDMYNKLGMKGHVELLKQLWRLQCENFANVVTLSTLCKYGREDPDSLNDEFLVKLVLTCIQQMFKGEELSMCLRHRWILKWIETQREIVNPERVISLIDYSLSGNEVHEQEIEYIIRALFGKLVIGMSAQQFLDLASQLSAPDSIHPTFNLLSPTLKIEMIQKLMLAINFPPLSFFMPSQPWYVINP